MANPSSRTTVTIDDNELNAFSVQFGVTTMHDHRGMPQMGTLATTINVEADMHDNGAMQFSTLQSLFTLANGVTRDKIVDIKIEFWLDERKEDALSVFSFRGWISSFFAISNEESNHIVSLTLVPELDKQQFYKISMSN